MSAGFTKGPWSIRDMPYAADGTKHYIDGPRGAVLATTYSRQSSDPRAKAEVRANARLIAAAPELYEALETATKKLRKCMGVAGNADFAIDACCEPFDAALAKARGEAA